MAESTLSVTDNCPCGGTIDLYAEGPWRADNLAKRHEAWMADHYPCRHQPSPPDDHRPVTEGHQGDADLVHANRLAADVREARRERAATEQKVDDYAMRIGRAEIQLARVEDRLTIYGADDAEAEPDLHQALAEVQAARRALAGQGLGLDGITMADAQEGARRAAEAIQRDGISMGDTDGE